MLLNLPVSVLALQSKRTAHSKGVLDDYLITVDTTSLDQHQLFYLHHCSSQSENCHVSVFHAALQAATILVAMASEKKFWRPKFSRKSPIGDQQIKRETYLKNYQ